MSQSPNSDRGRAARDRRHSRGARLLSHRPGGSSLLSSRLIPRHRQPRSGIMSVPPHRATAVRPAAADTGRACLHPCTADSRTAVRLSDRGRRVREGHARIGQPGEENRSNSVRQADGCAPGPDTARQTLIDPMVCTAGTASRSAIGGPEAPCLPAGPSPSFSPSAGGGAGLGPEVADDRSARQHQTSPVALVCKTDANSATELTEQVCSPSLRGFGEIQPDDMGRERRTSDAQTPQPRLSGLVQGHRAIRSRQTGTGHGCLPLGSRVPVPGSDMGMTVFAHFYDESHFECSHNAEGNLVLNTSSQGNDMSLFLSPTAARKLAAALNAALGLTVEEDPGSPGAIGGVQS